MLLLSVDVGPTCDRYTGTDGYFAGADSRTCYVTFPRRNWRAKQTWFQARNKCVWEGGDLADENVINLPLMKPDVDNPDVKYLVGLRHDVFTWIEISK